MPPSDVQRLALREQLTEVLQEGPATTLMESLPPIDWKEFATKADLAGFEERVNARFDAFRFEFDAKIAVLRGEMRDEIGKVRGEIGEMRGEMRGEIGGLRGEIGGLRGEFRGEIAGLRGEIAELRGEAKRDIARQTYVILAGMAAAMAPVYILLFGGAAG